MIEVRVNLGLLDRFVATLRKPDLRPAWKEARKPLRADIRDHRKKRSGPSGTWAARSANTRIKRKGRTRQMLGNLPTALSTIMDRRRIALKSRVAWSDVHQTGGRVGHGAKLPARPFLWASDRVLTEIAAIVTRTLQRIIGKAT